MRKTLKLITKFIAICVLLVLSSCEKDLYEDQIYKDNLANKIKMVQKPFGELLLNERFNTAYQIVTKSKTKAKTVAQGKTALEEQYDFTIVDKVPLKIITEEGKEGTTYIMLIERPVKENLKFENLIINDINGKLNARIFKYTLSKKGEKNEAHNGFELDIIDTEMINLEIDGKIDIPCVFTATLMCDDIGDPDSHGNYQYEHDHIATGFCITHSNNLYVLWGYECGSGANTGTDSGGETGGNTGSTGTGSTGTSTGNTGTNTGTTSSTGSSSSTGSNSGGASSPIPSSPIPCVACVKRKAPCEVLNSILNPPTGPLPSSPQNSISIKAAIQQLKNNVVGVNTHEEGFNFYYEPISGQMYAYPAITNGDSMVMYTNYFSIFGGAHFHQDGLQPQFSHDDIYILRNFISRFNVPSAVDNENYPAPMHLVVSDNGSVYAIMADDPEAFSTLIYDIYHDSDRRNDFKDRIESNYSKFFRPNTMTWFGTQTNYDESFLKFIQDVNQYTGNGNGNLGLKLYKANADLTNWSELTLVQSETNLNNYTITPIQCK